MIADTSGLLALFNRTEPAHEAVHRIVAELDRPLVVSPYVVAELDYLTATRVGVPAELSVLTELASGAYELVGFDSGDVLRAAEIIKRYRDQEIGVADASVVVLADRFGTRDLLSLDRRHFDVVRPLTGGRFKVLP